MSTTWPKIGTVVGNTSTYEFTFVLEQFKARVGDIVCVLMNIPSSDYLATEPALIWGRISDIDRFNPFFPYEAAQELSSVGISAFDTVLSTSKDLLQATCVVLGYTKPSDLKYHLYPVTYPIQPAADVIYPSVEAVSGLLQGDRSTGAQIAIGGMIARSDVKVTLTANPLVARHMAILAMTGGGKTVAARRIIRDLVEKGYPLVILDPHGDYLGLWEVWKKRGLFKGKRIRVFYPYITISEEDRNILNTLIAKMTTGLTDAQREVLDHALEQVDPKKSKTILQYAEGVMKVVDNLKFISKKSETADNDGLDGRLQRAKGPLKRALTTVYNKLLAMEKANQALRDRLDQYDWTPLPNPVSDPASIVAPNQVSILYLGGYDHLTQSTIVSILMERLFEHRANMSNRIPPFLTVVEEAHNFIPSAREGTSETPSIEPIRRIITEGRKFGTGLLLISQRPSRLDDTILSQCNSFLILRLVNPKDQKFVSQVMENLSEKDARMLPGFGPGQGIVSGQAVRFPLLVQIKMDEDLLVDAIGQEDFIEQAERWRESPAGKELAEDDELLEELDEIPTSRRGSRTKKGRTNGR